MAKLNSTVIGDYYKLKTQLPGPGGSGEVMIVDPHTRRTETPTEDELEALRELPAR